MAVTIRTVLRVIVKPLQAFAKTAWKILRSQFAKDAAMTALQLVPLIAGLVAEFAGAGFIPASVANLLKKYGLPLVAGLEDGHLSEDEVKAIVRESVVELIKSNHNVSGTVARIAANLAYLDEQAAQVNASVKAA